MSISKYEIANRVQTGELCALKPKAAGAPINRVLLLSKDMQAAVLKGPWDNVGERARLAEFLRADLERFVSGDLLRLSLGGRSLLGEDMKRLLRTYEIWEFKSGVGKDGIRVFGRFAGRDVFVATHWQWRNGLGKYDSPQWRAEITRCKDIWGSLFEKHTPHTGDQVDAYISDGEDAALFYS